MAKSKADKKRKEKAMDSGEGLPTGEDFVDDFEEEAKVNKPAFGRKALMQKAAQSAGETEPVLLKSKTQKTIKKKDTHGESAGPAKETFKNKQRVLALSSRGITQRWIFAYVQLMT